MVSGACVSNLAGRDAGDTSTRLITSPYSSPLQYLSPPPSSRCVGRLSGVHVLLRLWLKRTASAPSLPLPLPLQLLWPLLEFVKSCMTRIATRLECSDVSDLCERATLAAATALETAVSSLLVSAASRRWAEKRRRAELSSKSSLHASLSSNGMSSIRRRLRPAPAPLSHVAIDAVPPAAEPDSRALVNVLPRGGT